MASVKRVLELLQIRDGFSHLQKELLDNDDSMSDTVCISVRTYFRRGKKSSVPQHLGETSEKNVEIALQISRSSQKKGRRFSRH